MSVKIDSPPTPLRLDADGVIRVGNTRVPLDLIVYAYNDGTTAETLKRQYPTLELADIYATFAIYLHRRAEIDEYVAERRFAADAARKEFEARFPPEGIRERLLARRGTDAP